MKKLCRNLQPDSKSYMKVKEPVITKTIFEREPVGNGYSEWGATSTESGKAVINSITTASGTKVYSIAVNDWTPNN